MVGRYRWWGGHAPMMGRAIAVVIGAACASPIMMGAQARPPQPQVEISRAADGWVGISVQYDVLARQERGGARMIASTPPVILAVDPGSPADKAGLEAGDTILAINGETFVGRSVNDILADVHEGSKVAFTVRRAKVGQRVLRLVAVSRPEGKLSELAVTIRTPDGIGAEAPSAAGVRALGRDAATGSAGKTTLPTPRRELEFAPLAGLPIVAVVVPGGSARARVSAFTSSLGMVAGAELVRVDAALGDLLNVQQGVLVVNVFPGSPAAGADLRSGDVILRADSLLVTHPVLLVRAMRRAVDRELKLSIVRKHKKLVRVLKWDEPALLSPGPEIAPPPPPDR